jgi:hypothetical protein
MEQHEIDAVILDFKEHRKKRESVIVEQDQPLDEWGNLLTGMMQLVKDEHTPVKDTD